MNKKIMLGIIGAGRIGRLHAENITYHLRNAEIKAIADIYAGQMKAWAQGIGIGQVFADYRQVLQDPEIDAVLICSSTDTHAKLISETARANKHIFCEKPVDFDVPTINQALAAVKAAGVKLQIGFNRRFDRNFRRIHTAVRQGEIGVPHIIKVTSRDPEPPNLEYIKVSGGMFLDMTIHDFDMVRYLSGSEVTEVFAAGAVLVDEAIGAAGDIDTAVVTLKLQNGAIAVIDNSRKAAYGYDQRVEVFGSKGSIAVANDTPTTAVLSTGDGIISDKPKYFFLERYKESFIDELREFMAAIENDQEPPVTGVDGLKPVLIALAAKKSLAEGRSVQVEEL